MKLFTPATVLFLSAALAGAQVSLDPATNTFVCPAPSGAASLAFCAGDSLETNIIIRCEGLRGQPGNCNDNLAGIPPVGVKTFAPCYQSSPSAGDAACSFNGIAYPDSGSPFLIPSNTTSLSSIVTGSSKTSRKSLIGTQPTRNITIQATGTGSVRATGTGSVRATGIGSVRATGISALGFTTYTSGVRVVSGTKSKPTPTVVITATPDASSSVKIFKSYPLTSTSVTPKYEPPRSYSPEDTPESPVVPYGYGPRLPHFYGPGAKAIRDVPKYNGTSLVATASGTGAPAQTGSPVLPFSNSASVKGMGMWIISVLVMVL